MGGDELDEPSTDGTAPTLSPGVRARIEEPRAEIGLAPGLRIRHYELIRKIGEGGMGVVFVARDLKLGRRVAMKFITAPSTDVAHRFVAEARVTAACHHENIVIIYEVDAYRGTPYMVLEYVEGHTLRAEVGKSVLPPARAVELVLPVVRAMACAHDHGIVHRDLKMANILVAPSGVVKVVDFGVAKVLNENTGPSLRRAPPSRNGGVTDPALDEPTELFPEGSPSSATAHGFQVGTPAYMAPEQFGCADVDHRADIWALGIVMHRMVTGRHPISHPTTAALMFAAGDLDTPLDSVRTHAPKLPDALVHIIDRCLQKRVERRWPDARALLAALEALLPTHRGRSLGVGECPFPGLTAFQEADADRFFGRRRDTLRAVARLRERPLVAVVGPSGVGKSSFVRAGVIPALKATESWQVVTLRPGRTPIASIAGQLRSMGAPIDGPTGGPTARGSTPPALVGSVPLDLEQRLRGEPGVLGSILRAHARRTGGKLLLFLDQFEELYTLVPDPAERIAVTSALAGVADDPDSPVRVVVSLRSDFIDRVDEDRQFADDLLRGMLLLSPPGRDDLREVLVQPLAMVLHAFEDNAIVEHMINTLEATEGALPLLQFTAAQLWEARDTRRRLLTQAAYDQIGGVAGALATHADEVIRKLGGAQQRLAQFVFQRLVTPDRTRAIVERSDLEGLSRDPRDVRQLVDYLATERLLVVQARGAGARADDGATVEIVHESLITSWPTLRRWLDEIQEDSAFIAQLTVAAKQWEQHGRGVGLLWRGDAAEEAQRWRRRSSHVLGQREDAYLRAVLALADRAARIRRGLVFGTMAFLALLVAAAAVALVWIRSAERVARAETVKARAAEAQVVEQLELIQAKERERQHAVNLADVATVEVAGKREELKVTNAKLVKALEEAQAKGAIAARESEKAQKESERARAAAKQLEVLLAKERANVEKLKREAARITNTLR